MATSTRFTDTYSDIRDRWTLADLMDALEMIDFLDQLEHDQRQVSHGA